MCCIVIDDEPLAVDIITTYLEKIPDIEVVAQCTNPMDAIRILSKEHIDLIFLDIEMPHLNGMELIKSLNRLPQFIFTTAYPQYALEGFDLNATDYLVKPIPFSRFLKAIDKAKEKYQMNANKVLRAPANTVSEIREQFNFIFVKSEYENIKINTDDILYLQGLKDYIKIYTTTSQRAILTLSSFKDIQDRLPALKFLRVHRSFLINIDFIKALQKTKIVIRDKRIPIGETYRKEVLEYLNIP
jgi:DNA-binding LytR/AlgR family response regulator